MAELRILPKPLVRRPDPIDNLEYLREFGSSIEETRNLAAALDGVRGYAASYMTNNVNIEWGTDNRRKLPFKGPLGPSRGCHVDTSAGHIVLEEEGLWTCTAVTRARSTGYGGSDNGVVLYLSIRRPDGSIYDELWDDEQLGSGSGTLELSAPFLIPEPNYQVQAHIWSGKWRWIDGGTRFSRLAVVKHDNRTVNPGEGTVPDEQRN